MDAEGTRWARFETAPTGILELFQTAPTDIFKLFETAPTGILKLFQMVPTGISNCLKPRLPAFSNYRYCERHHGD